MQRGSILESARRDTKGGLLAGAILAGVCLAVLGLNWSYSLQLYVAGQALCDLIDMSQNDTRAVLNALAAKVPDILVEDDTEFGKRWLRDRAGCERDAKTRRSLPRSA
jgi:hypothetical protein